MQRERERRGWSQSELAKRLTEAGCPMQQSAIAKMEQTQSPRRITLDEAVGFARVFNRPLTDLVMPPSDVFDADLLAAVTAFEEASVDYQVMLNELERTLRKVRDLLEEEPGRGLPQTRQRFTEVARSVADAVTALGASYVLLADDLEGRD